MTITSFDNSNLHDIRVAIDSAFEDIKSEFGINLEIGRIKYDRDGSQFTTKLTGNIGVSQTRERKDFTRYAQNLCGLDPAWLDKSYTDNGKSYTITGLKTKATKNKIMLECSDGHEYVAPSDRVKRLMEKGGI